MKNMQKTNKQTQNMSGHLSEVGGHSPATP